MLADIRRSIAHGLEEKDKQALKASERKRRLSYIKTKRLLLKQAAEEELREQTLVEKKTYEEVRRARAERKLAERELRGLKVAPFTKIGQRAARAAYKIAKAPIRIVTAGARPGSAKKLSRFVFAPPGFFGPAQEKPKPQSRPKQEDDASMRDYIFGKKDLL